MGLRQIQDAGLCSRAAHHGHLIWPILSETAPGRGIASRVDLGGLHDPRRCHRESPQILPPHGGNKPKIYKMSQKNPNFSDPLPILQQCGCGPKSAPKAVAVAPRHLGGPVPLIEAENLSKPEAMPGFPEWVTACKRYNLGYTFAILYIIRSC